ncbi:MAG TPA: divalent-cation tolerance protein CutA [Candidatus Binataceae bacterium]|nr:divalent-cation tolerance protein CutA [Candidatus Binataceae bacterium]
MRSARAAALVLITCSNEEQGASIARTLLDERLAACVNIVDQVRSIYRWQGKIEDDRETLLLVKTGRALLPKVERRVRELHTYDVPEIMALSFDSGSQRYLEWLLGAVSQSRRKSTKS